MKNPKNITTPDFMSTYTAQATKNCLNRSGITDLAAFGDESYSKEELVAEIGAAMLYGVTGIVNSTIENSAAYMRSWLRKLKDDKKLIVQAAGQALKAADYIKGASIGKSVLYYRKILL